MIKNNYFARAIHSRYSFRHLNFLLLILNLLIGVSSNTFGQVFITTDVGIWVISKDEMLPRKVEGIKDQLIQSIESVDNQAFIGTDNGLWIIDKDRMIPRKVEGINTSVNGIKALGDQVFISTI